MTGIATPCAVCDFPYMTNARRVGPPLCSPKCAESHFKWRMESEQYLHLLCGNCTETKPETEFYRDNGRTCRRQRICKICSNAHFEKWKADNPEKALAVARKSSAKNKAAKLGITLEQRAEMWTAQGERCAICQEAPTSDRAMNLDHCHTTGVVRGILCRRCNVSIGQFEDRIDLLRNAIAYLERERSAVHS